MTEILNVIRLSDAFRQKNTTIEPPMGFIVGLGRSFSVSATYLRGEYPADNWTNRDALQAMMIPARKIVQFAASNMLDEVVLPYDGKSPCAKWVKKAICRPLSKEFGLKVTCNGEQFKPDYNGADMAVRTCLDEGVRGVVGVVPPWGVSSRSKREVA